jgi:RNA polymerase sigma-70 factor (ECF subfamily)
VAQSVILQHVRRARIVSIETVAEVDRLDVPHDQLSPDRHAIAYQELRRMGQLIAALPAKCRKAFVLRKVHGLSQREIAHRMHISESTVEKHIGKGVRLLADALGRGKGMQTDGNTSTSDLSETGHGKASQ